MVLRPQNYSNSNLRAFLFLGDSIALGPPTPHSAPSGSWPMLVIPHAPFMFAVPPGSRTCEHNALFSGASPACPLVAAPDHHVKQHKTVTNISLGLSWANPLHRSEIYFLLSISNHSSQTYLLFSFESDQFPKPVPFKDIVEVLVNRGADLEG